jgi:regulator of protease activity HflC (stomatin/prohibitin superfamily)
MAVFPSKGAAIAAACCFGVVFLSTAIMVGSAFAVMAPLEQGLKLNTFTKSITEGKVYLPGRYYLGLGRSFVKFPRTWQMIEFASGSDEGALTVRINGGSITLECSLQYSVITETMEDLYKNYEKAYHDRFVKIAQNSIKNEAAEHTPDVFYQERQALSAAILQRLRDDFDGVGAIVQAFQLRRVSLPAQNEERIIRVLLSGESQRTASMAQARAQIVAETSVIAGQEQQASDIFTSERRREATIITERAAATAKETVITVRARALQAFADDTGMASEDLLKYMYARALRTLNETTTLAVGFESIQGA